MGMHLQVDDPFNISNILFLSSYWPPLNSLGWALGTLIFPMLGILILFFSWRSCGGSLSCWNPVCNNCVMSRFHSILSYPLLIYSSLMFPELWEFRWYANVPQIDENILISLFGKSTWTMHWILWLSYLSYCLRKYFGQSKLKQPRFNLVSSLRVLSNMVGKSWIEAWGSWLYCSHYRRYFQHGGKITSRSLSELVSLHPRQKAEVNKCPCSTSLFLFT